MDKKPIPAHVIEQRAKQKLQRTKPLRGRRTRGEDYDVFRRINMHDGSKSYVGSGLAHMVKAHVKSIARV